MERNKEEVTRMVCEIVSRYALEAGMEVQPDANLREAYGIDSLTLVELLVEVEEVFGILFDSSSLTDDFFSTAASIAGYVSGKLEAA
ncbi:phosphopantetheine-binding protein [Gorillibacterium sp. sgz500922]|uniref:phosphopantetheine-binding protein n=1 Tax=Gorillibacterium sp. sgz500922 TaxID=3446694 RepID=UPI003F67C61E